MFPGHEINLGSIAGTTAVVFALGLVAVTIALRRARARRNALRDAHRADAYRRREGARQIKPNVVAVTVTLPAKPHADRDRDTIRA